MSIFNNVRTLPDTSEIKLLVKLKYGEINQDKDWLATLPPSVISSAFKDAAVYPYSESPELEIQVLSIMLRQPMNKERAHRAIYTALLRYHILHP